MPTDLAYPFSYTEAGDAATVSGRDFYEQHAFLLGIQVLGDTPGEPLTANQLTETTARIERTYAASPYFPNNVRVSVVDQRDEEITISVRLGAETSFTTTLPTSE